MAATAAAPDAPAAAAVVAPEATAPSYQKLSPGHRAELVAGIIALLRRLPGSGSDDELAGQKARYGLWVNLAPEWHYRNHVDILTTITHYSLRDRSGRFFDMVELALYAREYALAFDIMSLVTAPSGKLPLSPYPDLLSHLMAALLLNGDPEVLPHVRRVLSLLPRMRGNWYCARVWDMADRGDLAAIRELLSPDFVWYKWWSGYDHDLYPRLRVAGSPEAVEMLTALASTKLPFRDQWNQALCYHIFFSSDWEGTPPSLDMDLAVRTIQSGLGGKPVDLSPHWAEFGRRVRNVVVDTQHRCGLAVLGAVLDRGDPAALDLEAIARTVHRTGSTMDAEMGRAAEVFGPERVQRRLVLLGDPRFFEALWQAAPSVLRLDRIAAIAAEWGFPDVRAWAEERAAGPGKTPSSDPQTFAAALKTVWPRPPKAADHQVN